MEKLTGAIVLGALILPMQPIANLRLSVDVLLRSTSAKRAIVIRLPLTESTKNSRNTPELVPRRAFSSNYP